MLHAKELNHSLAGRLKDLVQFQHRTDGCGDLLNRFEIPRPLGGFLGGFLLIGSQSRVLNGRSRLGGE